MTKNDASQHLQSTTDSSAHGTAASHAERLAQKVMHNDLTGFPLSRLLDAKDLMMTMLNPLPASPEASLVRNLTLVTTAVIELEDPRSYLNGHELLLITGLGLPQTAGEIDAYVERLCASGITALGFGVEPVYSEVPDQLTDACRKHGLPLIKIDAEVRFVQVTNRFAQEMHNTRLRGLQYVSTMARRLTKASLVRNPARQLVTTLAQLTDSWAILRRGEDVFQTGTAPSGIDTDELLRNYAAKLAVIPGSRGDAPKQAFGTIQTSHTHYEVTALGIRPPNTRTATMTELLIVKAPRITSDDRTGLTLAADLLQLILALPRSQSIALDTLMMTLLVDEAPPGQTSATASRIDQLVAHSLGSARGKLGHAIVAISANGDSPRADDLIWWRLLLNTPFVDNRGEQLRAVVSAPPGASVIETCEERGWLLSVSSEHPGHLLNTAMREAELLIPSVRELGRSVQFAEGLTSLGSLIPPELSTRFAGTVLAPITSSEDPEVEDILASLHSWLRRNGGWDASARELGLHRNTVRRHIRLAGTMLGRDLDDALVRADVLFALEHRTNSAGIHRS